LNEKSAFAEKLRKLRLLSMKKLSTGCARFVIQSELITFIVAGPNVPVPRVKPYGASIVEK
jgi:hypothetical protein